MVQRSVTEDCAFNPVTVELFEEGDVMVAPLADPSIVHCPVPDVGALAASVNDPLLHFD